MWSIAASRPTVMNRPLPIAGRGDEHGAMHVVVDRTRCMGSGRCEATAPDLFEVGDDGVVLLLAGNVTPGQVDAVTAAVERCPNEALKMFED